MHADGVHSHYHKFTSLSGYAIHGTIASSACGGSRQLCCSAPLVTPSGTHRGETCWQHPSYSLHELPERHFRAAALTSIRQADCYRNGLQSIAIYITSPKWP